MGELNLIPYEFKAKQESQGNRKILFMGLIAAVVVLVIAIAAPLAYKLKLKSDLDDVNKEVKVQQQALDSSNTKMKQLNAIKKQLAVVKTLSQEIYLSSEQVDGLKQLIPQDVYVSNITYAMHTRVITLTGYSNSYASINKFAAKLQLSKDYANARLGSIAQKDASSFTYTITIDLKNGGVSNAKSN